MFDVAVWFLVKEPFAFFMSQQPVLNERTSPDKSHIYKFWQLIKSALWPLLAGSNRTSSVSDNQGVALPIPANVQQSHEGKQLEALPSSPDSDGPVSSQVRLSQLMFLLALRPHHILTKEFSENEGWGAIRAEQQWLIWRQRSPFSSAQGNPAPEQQAAFLAWHKSCFWWRH